MKRKILPEQVKEGMYICSFGGSWFDHPFWRVKFVLKTPKDIERVQRSDVPYVLIDDELGIGPDDTVMVETLTPERPPSPIRIVKPIRPQPRSRVSPSAFPGTKGDSERKRTQALVSRSTKIMRQVFDGARLGRAVRIDEVLDIVDDIVETVEHCPRTLLDIVRLKNKDEYTYLHSVAVCTLMVNAARFMEMEEAEIRDFGLAGLLHDIGKMGIPETVLNKPGRLTDAEFLAVRAHPEHGHKLLCDTPNVTEMALDVCLHHHEKMDGTGYPFGLPGNALSLAARLGAVCDVYDAVTSDRIYKEAWTPTQAIAAMWDWEGHFDRDLLFTFMRSIGVFPAGMLVQLRSNRLGIVLDNKRRNARPRVLSFYSTRERSFIEPEEVVIKDSLASDSIIAAATPQEWGLADWEHRAERLVANRH